MNVSEGRGGTRIMIVDDHPVVREGYRRLIELHPGFKIVAEAGDAREAYSRYRQEEPDVVIMDITLPGPSGIEALRHIRQYDRRARVVVFTMHQGAAFAMKAIEAGASGYITKSSAPQELIHAVEAVLEGRTAISPDVMHEIASERLGSAACHLEDLTPRQAEILRLLAIGRTTEEIAAALSISTKTVQNNHYQIKSILGARTDAQLVWISIEAGLVPIEASSAVEGLERGGET